jgi:hypothetical protein
MPTKNESVDLVDWINKNHSGGKPAASEEAAALDRQPVSAASRRALPTLQPGKFSLVFQGLKQDFSGNAKSSLAVLLRTTPARIEVLAKSPGRVIKSGLSREAAFRYQAAIAKAGGVAEIRDEDPDIATLEVNTSSLDFDLTALSGSQPSVIDPLEIIPAPAPEPEVLRTARRLRRWALLSTLGIAVIAAALYFGFPLIAPWFPGIHPEPTPLERVLVLGAKTQPAFQALEANGGVARDGRWRGFLASGAEPLYGPEGQLKGFTVHLRKSVLPPHRLPSITAMEAALKPECGTTWNGEDDLMAENGDIACSITLGQQNIDVFMGSAK